MAKITKSFSFEIPVTNLSTINAKITSNLIGNIEVDGVVTLMKSRDHEIDYNSIKWNGTDILPLLDNFSGADDMMDSIMTASLNHVANTFDLDDILGTPQREDFETHVHPMFNYLSKLFNPATNTNCLNNH